MLLRFFARLIAPSVVGNNPTTREEAIRIKPMRTTGTEARPGARTDDRLTSLGRFDAQFAELLETIWTCERQWTIDDHIDAAIKYGR